jgi:predicted RNA binding protein YcfA (HicA-like mRNA interferase family)
MRERGSPAPAFCARPTAALASINDAEEVPGREEALTEAGWRVARQSGSHEVWAHDDHEVRIVVAGQNSDTVPAGTLGSIRRATGLEHLR